MIKAYATFAPAAEENYTENYSHSKWNFPSGELGIELHNTDDLQNLHSITIDAQISTAEDIMELLLLADAIKNKNKSKDYKLNLTLPYIPFGRQDRYTTNHTSFSLKVFADMINSVGFDKVLTNTPHSNVSELLINNLVVSEFGDDKHLNFLFRETVLLDGKDVVFIAPDAGAEKRVYKAAKEFGVSEVYVCSKQRNPATGEITGYSVPAIPKDKRLVVIDDICDGGGTFIHLASYLPKERKDLTLFVVHGIMSRGYKPLHNAGYDKVVAGYDFLKTYVEKEDA